MTNQIVLTSVSVLSPARLVWPDIYRSLAMVLIVVFHMTYPIRSQLGGLADYVGVLSESGTMMFVFLSGFLFAYKENTKGYMRFVWGKATQLFLPYAVASGVVIALRLVRHGDFGLAGFFLEFLSSLPTGGAAAPFWFVPMLMGFFLLEPLWRALNRQCWSSYLYFGLLALPFVVGRGQVQELGRNTLYFLPFFVLGIEFARHRETWTIWLIRVRWILLCMAIVFLTITNYTAINGVQTLVKIILTLALLGICLGAHKSNRIIGANSRNTMMVYLYHNSMIGIIFVPLFARLDLHLPVVWLGVLMVSSVIGTGGLSFGASILAMILDKIGIKNHKWLLGF